MDPVSSLGSLQLQALPPVVQAKMRPDEALTEGLRTVSVPAGEPALGGADAARGNSFADMLGTLVREVGAKQDASTAAVNGILSGQDIPLHQAMIAMEEANVSFQLMVEVRNKLLESYQELMRMQI